MIIKNRKLLPYLTFFYIYDLVMKYEPIDQFIHVSHRTYNRT
jgi:hypothetical protein